MSEPAVIIIYNSETWKPSRILFHASTHEETKRLQEVFKGISRAVMREPLKWVRYAETLWLKLKLWWLERQIRPEFDPALSLRIDAILGQMEKMS